MTTHRDLDILQLTHPRDADPGIRRQLTDCWIAVTNTGGAAGFPFPPVNASHVAPAVDTLASRLDPQRSRILLARSAAPSPDGWSSPATKWASSNSTSRLAAEQDSKISTLGSAGGKQGAGQASSGSPTTTPETRS